MEHRKWNCLRCSGGEFDTGEIRVSGGFWSRIFDVQNKKYSAVTCQKCGFTEFYARPASTLGNVFDFFTR
jgi:predicted nucleic-acid-binding Zn-ribbon protein